MSYLDELNEVQRQAVEHISGPSMVIAGAGSGKTRVLTYKITHLLKNNVDPFNILSLTFTNKAAKEMKLRISQIVGDGEAKNIWMGTFHSIFAKILRFEAAKLGYPSNFTIYDTDDAKSLLRTIIKQYNLDDKVYKPNIVLNRISSAKNNLITAAAYQNNTSIQSDDRQAAKPKIGQIYAEYEKRCFRAGAMDFDDLLFKTNVLLRDFPDVLFKYQDKFRHILVDEFQDTNFSQYTILKKLAARFENICVVGDDAQSIYAFRGANIQNILNFKKDYPDTKTFKLEQNYRSTQTIVKAANSIIERNRDQIKKDVWTSNDEGAKITVLKALSDNEEGLNVASQILNVQHNEGAKNQDFAILYRTNSQSRSIEEALRKKGLKYRMYGGLSFYNRKEIKDLIAYFRAAVNHQDEEAIKRIINYPKRGIGKASMDQVIVTASENETSLWQVISNVRTVNLQIGAGAKNKINDFAMMLKSLKVRMDTSSAYDIAKEIASTSGLSSELYADKTPEGVSRHENVQELLNAIKEFSERKDVPAEELTLPKFIEDIALLTDADNDKDDDPDKVSLMTIHASKGLEFPHVFIVGLEENLFPSQLALNSRSELEEERRLFYVAVTRAERGLNLSFATSRYRWGNLTSCEPSRFLEEIDPKFLANSALTPARQSTMTTNTVAKSAKTPRPSMLPPRRKLVKVNTRPSTNFQASDLRNLSVGMQVEHQKFGMGKVEQMEGAYPNTKATVVFSSVGSKQLLLKFAKLKIVE